MPERVRASTKRRVSIAALLCSLLAVLAWPVPARSAPPQQTSGPLLTAADERLFVETGFRVADDRVLGYFRGLGGVPVFGYPISRSMLFLGTRVQLFQRHALQLQPDGRVTLLNLLEGGILPFTEFGDASVPAADALYAAAAPIAGTAGYASAAATFVRVNVLDEWQGQPVAFMDAFLEPARLAGETDPVRQVLIGLEVLGFPASAPAADPNNASFVYQRFQRGVLHYDAARGTTQPLLLADYVKALLRAELLPQRLADQALTENSVLLHQYDPGRPLWLARPELLPATDLTLAFERDDRPVSAIVRPRTPTPVSLFGGLPGLTGPAGSLGPSAMPTFTPLPEATAVSVQPTPTRPTSTPTPIAAQPVLERTEPGAVEVGQDILLRGRNFGAEKGQVLFTGKLADAQIWSDNTIIVTVPQGARDGTVRIRRTDGAFSNEVGFAPSATATPPTPPTTPEPSTPTPTVTPSVTPTPGPPVITSLNPHYGRPDTSLIILGSSFGATTGQVLVGSSFASVETNGWSDTSIAVRVPSDLSAGQTVRVFVRRPEGQLNQSPKCFVVQGSLSPTATAGGIASPTATPITPTPQPPTGC